MMPSPAAVAEINLGYLIDNVRAIRRKAAPAALIPVVKADAYGHGALPVVQALVREGYDLFAVAQLREALALRRGGIDRPILVFGRLFPDEIPRAVSAGLHLTLFSKQDIQWIAAAGLREPARVHVNLETGMGRVGVMLAQEPDFFDALAQAPACRLEGIYSHFSTADEADKAYALTQLMRFRTLLSAAAAKIPLPRRIHLANSAAVLDMPETYFNCVRPGIIVYGHYPSAQTSRSVALKPVMAFQTVVAHVRDMPGGHPISYGRRFVTDGPTRIAVLPVGYADGLRRDFSNRGRVLIRGRAYPLVGTITMDQSMVNVGRDPVEHGDEVLLWGESSQGCIDVGGIAADIGTIPYELTCGVSSRVPRVYRR